MDLLQIIPRLGHRVLRLPYNIDFSLLPPGPIPMWLGTGTIVGGTARIVPALGPEIIINGTFDTDLTGWLSDLLDTFEWLAGTMHIVETGATYSSAYQNSVFTIGNWYQIGADIVNISGTSLIIQEGANTTITTRSTSGNVLRRFQSIVGGAARFKINNNPANWTIDNVTVKMLILSSLFSGPAIKTGRLNIRVSTTWAGITSGFRQGTAIIDNLLDPTCGLVAYHSGTGVTLRKFTTPLSWVTLVSVVTAYVPGAAIEIRRIGTVVQLWYNGVQQGTDQTVSDAIIMNSRYATIFGTYATDPAPSFLVEAI